MMKRAFAPAAHKGDATRSDIQGRDKDPVLSSQPGQHSAGWIEPDPAVRMCVPGHAPALLALAHTCSGLVAGAFAANMDMAVFSNI
jgi:hypothetical protein